MNSAFFNYHSGNFHFNNESHNGFCLITENRTVTAEEFVKHINTFELRLLRQIGTNRNIPLLIEGHKEAEFVYCIIACLKNNIPFIPIERLWPEERKKNIQNQFSKCYYVNCNSIDIISPIKNGTGIDELPESTAYVLFTSGSTGTPKGVCIGKPALIHFYESMKTNFLLNNTDVIVNVSLFVFDVFLFELLLSLHYSCGLVLLDNSHYQNPDKCIEFLREHSASFINCTPTFVRLLCKHPEFNQLNLQKMKSLILMGENFSNILLTELSARFPDLNLYNGYGPTEATVICSLKKFEKNNSPQLISAGKPIGKMKFSIKENTSEGELIIEGPQLYTAYILNGELNYRNSEQYLSGDIFKYTNEEWHFIQRNDRQYKWHGYRIEAGEIESVLLSNKNVKQACCLLVPVNENNSRLICFYESSEKLDHAKAREEMAKNLPSYLLSIELFEIKQWPLNSSLKTDEKLLISQYLLK